MSLSRYFYNSKINSEKRSNTSFFRASASYETLPVPKSYEFQDNAECNFSSLKSRDPKDHLEID